MVVVLYAVKWAIEVSAGKNFMESIVVWSFLKALDVSHSGVTA